MVADYLQTDVGLASEQLARTPAEIRLEISGSLVLYERFVWILLEMYPDVVFFKKPPHQNKKISAFLFRFDVSEIIPRKHKKCFQVSIGYSNKFPFRMSRHLSWKIPGVLQLSSVSSRTIADCPEVLEVFSTETLKEKVVSCPVGCSRCWRTTGCHRRSDALAAQKSDTKGS